MISLAGVCKILVKNMKNFIAALSSIVVFASCISKVAHADDTKNLKYYIGGQYNIPSRVYTDLYGGDHAIKQLFPNMDLAIGTKINDHFRVEVASGYRSYKYNMNFYDGYSDVNDKIKRLDLSKIMFNTYVEGGKFGDIFTPYVMAGIGYAHIHKKKLEYSHKIPMLHSEDTGSSLVYGNDFAWQTGVGINVALTKNTSIDIGVIYADYGRMRFKGQQTPNDFTASKLRGLETLIGFKYHF
jgi:opacity protein-like surface antigen